MPFVRGVEDSPTVAQVSTTTQGEGEGGGGQGEDLRDRVAGGRIDDHAVWNLWGLALCASRQGNQERAAQLFGGAVKLSETTGFPVSPVDRATFDSDIDEVCLAMGRPAFAVALSAGAARDRTDLFAYALEE